MNNLGPIVEDYENLARKVEHQNEMLHQILNERKQTRQRVANSFNNALGFVRKYIPKVSVSFNRQ